MSSNGVGWDASTTLQTLVYSCVRHWPCPQGPRQLSYGLQCQEGTDWVCSSQRLGQDLQGEGYRSSQQAKVPLLAVAWGRMGETYALQRG